MLSARALALSLDQMSLPLLRVVFGGARDALQENTGLQQCNSSPSSYCYANRLSIIRRKLQDERDPFPELLAYLDA